MKTIDINNPVELKELIGTKYYTVRQSDYKRGEATIEIIKVGRLKGEPAALIKMGAVTMTCELKSSGNRVYIMLPNSERRYHNVCIQEDIIESEGV